MHRARTIDMSRITASDLCVTLGGRQILHGIDLNLQDGEIVTVVGPNGSGKSTLMRTLIGALPVASGTLEIRPGTTIGYVPQKLDIDETMPMSVGRFLNLPRARPTADVIATLDRVALPDFKDKQIAALSGGQLRRVLLARALLRQPDVLILDEPTAGLDQPGIADFYDLIASVRDETGAAIVMVSHDLHVVMSASDRVICLNGHVCCEGTPAVVSAAPEYRELFGEGTHGALALYRHAHDHDHDHHHHHD